MMIWITAVSIFCIKPFEFITYKIMYHSQFIIISNHKLGIVFVYIPSDCSIKGIFQLVSSAIFNITTFIQIMNCSVIINPLILSSPRPSLFRECVSFSCKIIKKL